MKRSLLGCAWLWYFLFTWLDFLRVFFGALALLSSELYLRAQTKLFCKKFFCQTSGMLSRFLASNFLVATLLFFSRPVFLSPLCQIKSPSLQSIRLSTSTNLVRVLGYQLPSTACRGPHITSKREVRPVGMASSSLVGRGKVELVAL